jgi:hypothetical protein
VNFTLQQVKFSHAPLFDLQLQLRHILFRME